MNFYPAPVGALVTNGCINPQLGSYQEVLAFLA